jgi:hypothetical protein
MAGTATFNMFAYLRPACRDPLGCPLLRDLVGDASEPRRDLLTWAPVATQADLRPPSQTISLRAFSGSARTTLWAGFARIVIGSPVNGFVPGRALVASLRTTLSFRRPGTMN